jgi:hypothetical protein
VPDNGEESLFSAIPQIVMLRRSPYDTTLSLFAVGFSVSHVGFSIRQWVITCDNFSGAYQTPRKEILD